MSRNDITGDNIATRAVSDAYRKNWEAIFRKGPAYRCKFCGEKSFVEPADQHKPADYCTDFDHGVEE